MTRLDLAPCRLSESSLWTDQRAFFQREGVTAWSSGIVPHYVTSNPYMAKTYANLAMAFVRDGGGPDDFYRVKRALVPQAASLTLDQQLAYLRLSGWDAKVFLDLYPSLVDHVSETTPAQREEVAATVRSVWDMYFPIGERDELALSLGLVLVRAEAWGEAAEMFHRSLALTGPEPQAATGIALCHYARGDVASATRWLDEALRVQPSNGVARNLKQALGSQTRRRRRSRSKGA